MLYQSNGNKINVQSKRRHTISQIKVTNTKVIAHITNRIIKYKRNSKINLTQFFGAHYFSYA
jgi:hypothetical protein